MASPDVKRTASIYINDADAQRALKRLQDEAKHLVKRLEEVPVGSKDFKDISSRLTAVQRNMKALADDTKAQDGWFKKMQGSLGPLPKMLAGVFAFDAIKSGFNATLDAHREHERAVAKVTTALQNEGKQAGVTFPEIAEEANRLQENSLFSDEDILAKASTSLLNFGTIAGENFKRANQVAVDLSTTMDGDLQGAAMAVGKALNNPVQGLTALQRMGVRFTDEQKSVIKSLVDTGKAGEAQALILGELEKRFAGQAKAQAEAEGGYHKLKVAVDELAEGIGGKLSGAFSTLSGWMGDAINQAAEWLGLSKRQSDAMAEQRVEMNALFNVLRSGNVTQQQRAELVARLNKEYAEFLPRQLDVTDSEEDLAKAQVATNQAMKERILLLAKQELLQDAQADAVEEQKEALEAELDLQRVRQTGGTVLENLRARALGFANATAYQTWVLQKQREHAVEADAALADLSKRLGDVTNATREAAGAGDGAGVGLAVDMPDTEEMDKRTEEVRKLLSDARARLDADRKSGLQKELDEVAHHYWELAQRAEGSAVGLEEIENQRMEAMAAVRAKWAQKELDELRKLDEKIAGLRAEARLREQDELAQDEARIHQKYEPLYQAAKDHKDRMVALQELEAQELEAARQRHAEERQQAVDAAFSAQEQERMAGVQQRLAQMDTEFELELEKLGENEEARTALRLEHEQARAELEAELDDARRQAVNERFEQLYAEFDAQGLSTQELQRLHGEAMAAIDAEANARLVRQAQEKNAKLLESERRRNAATQALALEFVDVMGAAFALAASDAKEAQDYHKLVTAAKLAVDTASAIGEMTKKGALTSLTPIDAALKIATGIGIVLVNIGKARALLEQGDAPPVPAFATGGTTAAAVQGALPHISEGGRVARPTLGLFGEKGPEWVAPNSMYEHPVLAPVFHWLEEIRVTGRIPNAYDEGGRTRGTALVNDWGGDDGPPGRAGTTTESARDGDWPMEQVVGVLVGLQNSVNQLNAQLAAGIEARTSYDQQLEDQERMTTIKTTANRSR